MSELINAQHNEGGASGLGYSELEAYLRCPKEDQFGRVRGIHRPTASSPDYFAVGSFLHAGRARWFAQKQDIGAETWKLIQEDVTKTREGLPLPCSDEAEVTALRYLQEYIDHWSVRPKPNIVAVEHMLGPSELLPDFPETARTARLDDFGFYPEAGGLAIGECKTTSAPISDVINQYEVHGQPNLQQVLWDLAPQGAAMYGAVKGTVMDVVQKGYGGRRCQFARIFVPVNEKVKKWVAATMADSLLLRSRANWNSDVRRNVTACTRLIGKARVACQFRDLCEHGKAASTSYAFKDGRSLTEWQPNNEQEVAPWE